MLERNIGCCASGTPADLSAEQQAILADFLHKVPKDQMELVRFPPETETFFGFVHGASRPHQTTETSTFFIKKIPRIACTDAGAAFSVPASMTVRLRSSLWQKPRHGDYRMPSLVWLLEPPLKFLVVWKASLVASSTLEIILSFSNNSPLFSLFSDELFGFYRELRALGSPNLKALYVSCALTSQSLLSLLLQLKHTSQFRTGMGVLFISSALGLSMSTQWFFLLTSNAW